MTLYHSIICFFKNLICHKNIFMETYNYIIVFNGYMVFCLMDIAIFYFKVCHYWVFILFPGFCLFFGFCLIKYNVVINMEVELSGQMLYVCYWEILSFLNCSVETCIIFCSIWGYLIPHTLANTGHIIIRFHLCLSAR